MAVWDFMGSHCQNPIHMKENSLIKTMYIEGYYEPGTNLDNYNNPVNKPT